jgi:hypothetical protein
MPSDPATTQPASNTTAGYPYGTQPAGSYQPPTYTQPTNAWGQPTHVAQAGYTPTAQPNTVGGNPQYAANGQVIAGTTTGTGPAPGQAGQPPLGYVTNTPPREPASPSDRLNTTSTTAAQSDGQWLPLTLVLIGFLTSLACNMYFGWYTYQLRERYRLLLADRGGAFG